MRYEYAKGWSAYLTESLNNFKSPPFEVETRSKVVFKQTINCSANFLSILLDKDEFAKNRHSWSVINSFIKLEPQSYLKPSLRNRFLQL